MNDYFTESRQNRELEELREQMSAAASEASTLRFRLSQVQGSMETRLERLTTAFNAFVELSDIRYDLIGFANAAEVRRHAGQVLAALASGETPVASERDVPAYWLGPAVEAIRGLAAGDPDEAALTEALKRDELRTSVFLCLGLAALGRRNEVRAQWLETAFGQVSADGTVTRVQRALWTTAARGGFGIEGQNAIIGKLQVPSTAGAGRWAVKIQEGADRVPVTGPAFKELVAPAKAHADLIRLRAAVELITGDTSVLEPDTALAYAAGDKPDPDSTSAVLRLLISEGSEPERAALARVAELRVQLTDGAAAGGGTLGDQAGTIDKLLEVDLANTEEPHLAAAALRVVYPGVLADAEMLAQTATAASPLQVTAEIEWRPVTLLPDGPDRLSLAAAEAAIAGTVQPLGVRDVRGAVATAVAGLVVAVGLGLTHPLWIAIGLAVVGFAGFSFWTAHQKRAAEQADAVTRITRLRAESTEAAAQLAAYRGRDRDRAADVAAELTALRKRLAS
ncbi:hypothetical protein [Kribbella sp. CA-293567]|uniref:hypothetical protein n=1 Tax=Kribbella sp. CA-293567 TaxID=3002436 RepID=UPI0022DCEF78|nr:hypothetical protein [Kribbella sp. CA-293567]WBQ03680.1 hypothetical protein OX958_27365 [Kribbella sp. CA-293567]